MQKYTIIVLTIVVVAMGIVVGALAYNYKLLDESFSLCSDSSLKLTYKHQECIKRQNTVQEEKAINEDQMISSFKTILGNYELYFEYPIKYSVIDPRDYQWTLSSYNGDLTLLTKQLDTNVKDSLSDDKRYKFEEKASPLIQFFNEAQNLGGEPYGVPSSTVVKINGNEYQAKEYSFGETDGGYWDLSFDWTIIELEKDLFVKVLYSHDKTETFCIDTNSISSGSNDVFSNCNDPAWFVECLASCENYEPKKLYLFETSHEDIDNAYKILETLKWEKLV